jgi:hypothetical protein
VDPFIITGHSYTCPYLAFSHYLSGSLAYSQLEMWLKRKQEALSSNARSMKKKKKNPAPY